MSNKKDNEKENEKKRVISNEKKGKQNLRFAIPEVSRSEDSFTSALSYVGVAQESDDSSEEAQASVLKKYVLTPLRHTRAPRTTSSRPCFSPQIPDAVSLAESTAILTQASSSRQLFEILKHSPTPSDADVHLISATYLGKLEGVKEAIRNGADVNTFRDSQTPLLIATEVGDDKIVSYLLTVPDIKIDIRNVFGQTSLFIAMRNNFDKIVRMLLNHNADVNLADHMGSSPLHVALFKQQPNAARLLLAHGADHELADCFGERPMYTAVVKKPDLECVMVLVRVGASTEYNVTGVPLLSRAILNLTEFRIIKTLVKYGASVNSRDFYSGKTPLHFAAIVNDLNVAMFLVRRGANVNLKTIYNFTPFDEAVFHRSLEVAQYLAQLTKNPTTKMPTVTRFADA